jgi:4-hydroxyphenylpyruvate dioxygenase
LKGSVPRACSFSPDSHHLLPFSPHSALPRTRSNICLPAMSFPVFSTFTHSVGAHTAGHSLPSKLRAIKRAGYRAVEIFQDDLDSFLSSEEFEIIYKCQTPPDSPSHSHTLLQDHSDASASSSSSAKRIGSGKEEEKKTAWNAHGPCTPTEVAKELFCASYIAGLCSTLGLQVLTLQPMRDVEGWASPDDRHAAFMRVQSRFAIMRALGTDLMIICSNNQHAPATTSDYDAMANDLRELADEAARYQDRMTAATLPQSSSPSSSSSTPSSVPASSTQERPIRIAYEALSWGAHVDKWSQAWDIVQRVNRPNVGMCFDSFNTLGREYADPCSPTGIQEPEEDTLHALRQSFEGITKVPAEKIFFMQVGDARKMKEPLAPSPNKEEPRPARMIWSRASRLFPGEINEGGFMPVVDFVKAVTVGAGYTGPWSNEVFNSSLNEEGAAMEDEHARRGFQGLSWLAKQVYPSQDQ